MNDVRRLNECFMRSNIMFINVGVYFLELVFLVNVLYLS